MSRTAESWATLGAVLAKLEGTPAPWGLDRAGTRKLAALLGHLRLVARDLVEQYGPTEAAQRLGVARSTLALWTAPGGWLAE